LGDFEDTFGTGSDAVDIIDRFARQEARETAQQNTLPIKTKDKAKKVFFTTQKEAEARTGYFGVSSLMITWELADKISAYIRKNNLSTFSQPNQAKTSDNTYTLNFTLKRYSDSEKRRAYISKSGAIGYYKHTLKTKKYRFNSGHSDEFIQTHQPKEEDIKKFEELEARSPTLEKMYFWIVQKYPRDLLWMDYHTSDPMQSIFKDNDAK
jgi:hypothetical protein